MRVIKFSLIVYMFGIKVVRQFVKSQEIQIKRKSGKKNKKKFFLIFLSIFCNCKFCPAVCRQDKNKKNMLQDI